MGWGSLSVRVSRVNLCHDCCPRPLARSANWVRRGQRKSSTDKEARLRFAGRSGAWQSVWTRKLGGVDRRRWTSKSTLGHADARKKKPISGDQRKKSRPLSSFARRAVYYHYDARTKLTVDTTPPASSPQLDITIRRQRQSNERTRRVHLPASFEPANTDTGTTVTGTTTSTTRRGTHNRTETDGTHGTTE